MAFIETVAPSGGGGGGTERLFYIDGTAVNDTVVCSKTMTIPFDGNYVAFGFALGTTANPISASPNFLVYLYGTGYISATNVIGDASSSTSVGCWGWASAFTATKDSQVQIQIAGNGQRGTSTSLLLFHNPANIDFAKIASAYSDTVKGSTPASVTITPSNTSIGFALCRNINNAPIEDYITASYQLSNGNTISERREPVEIVCPVTSAAYLVKPAIIYPSDKSSVASSATYKITNSGSNSASRLIFF